MAQKILIVDDDASFTDIFKKTLTSAGFETLSAENGEEGIEKAKSELPDLIFLDLMMPSVDGNEILKRLKADEVTSQIPVIILTNFGQEEGVKEAFYNGASDVLLKYQIDSVDLVNKVNAFLKHQKK